MKYWVTPFGSELRCGTRRAGHRGDGEQQQQEQRRAHAGELAPEPAQPADEAELRLVDLVGAPGVGGLARRRDQMAGTKPPITALQLEIMTVQTPVTMSTPIDDQQHAADDVDGTDVPLEECDRPGRPS